MTLFIAFLLIAGFGFSWVWYPIALILWIIRNNIKES